MRHYHHHNYASSHHHHYAWSHHHSANKEGVDSALGSIFVGIIILIFAITFILGVVFMFIRVGMPIFFLFPFVAVPIIMIIVAIKSIARASRLSKSKPSVDESEPIENNSEEREPEESEPSYVEESTPTSTSSSSQNHVVEDYRCPNCSYIYDRAKGKCPICGLPPEEK